MTWLANLMIPLIMKYIITPKNIKKLAQTFVNSAEKYVLGTASKVDDNYVLPIIKATKEAFDL